MDRWDFDRCQRLGMVSFDSEPADISLIAVKVLLGLGLLSYSALRQSGMDEREAEDAVNNFGRAPVGISKEEMVSVAYPL